MANSRWKLLLLIPAIASCDDERKTLLGQLQSARPEERATAIRKLGERGKQDELALLLKAAKDQASIVRAEAATGLGLSRDPRVIDVLGELLADPEQRLQRLRRWRWVTQERKGQGLPHGQYGRSGRTTREAVVGR